MGIVGKVSTFGEAVAERFATGAGEPEQLLRGPFEELIRGLGEACNITGVVVAGEHHLPDEQVRPDYAVHVNGALVGFAELKAPGKGVDTARYRGHDRRQWQRLACLPNVLYTDGQEFALFRYGEQVGDPVRLEGDVRTAGPKLASPGESLLAIAEDFLRWQPIAPKRPRELAHTTARLCRVLRAEVSQSLTAGSRGLRDLARDWRALLYPDATDEEFADGYAQTVTFALLLARVEGIALDGRDLREVADELGARHTLMARALAVLTDPVVLPDLAVSVKTLHRVLSVVDWPTLSKADPKVWLLFYEEFLGEYDQTLRKQTGSYYTPSEAVDPMVRLVDDLLKTRLGHQQGFASSGVTVMDPAAGTGTFLFRVVDRIASEVEADQGPGAVGPALRKAAERLIGFEIQAGPFSVAELRLSTEFQRRGAELEKDHLRLYLTDTLSNPFLEETQLAATYRPIAISRQRANEVKREEPIVVVLGNPPYRERSRNQGGWVENGDPESAQEAPLRDFFPPPELGAGAHAKHLYNLYVYFWRWALWKVFERHPGDRGVIAFVSVAGFLHGPGFAQMRKWMRINSDEIWVIDCSPEGHQPEVATRIFSGVQQPICITIALRGGTTGPDVSAPVRFSSIAGTRAEKFTALSELDLSGGEWADCPTDWYAPFRPEGGEDWSAMPALDQLLGWSGSGTMPGRTWVVAPSPKLLERRWERLVTAPEEERPRLMVEHKRDRNIHTQLSDNLPGSPVGGPIATETRSCLEPARYGWRTLDRGWIIPDKRVVNQPNPGLWQIRNAPDQVFLTAIDAASPTRGPAVTFTALVPDLDHYHGRGGRVFPLWLDRTSTRPNAAPGLLDFLSVRLHREVDGPALFAYIAGVAAHPAYLRRFAADLGVPGLRIPLTSDGGLFDRITELGRRVVWLYTYGERYGDTQAGRPLGPPQMPEAQRPLVQTNIPDGPREMPESIEFDSADNALIVGSGRITGVTPAMWDYETSGYKLVRRWFAKRKRNPDGRRRSPLDEIVATSWDADWTTELIQLLNVIGLLVELEPKQEDLLNEILKMPTISVGDLRKAGVLPVEKRPAPERPAKQGRLA